MHKFSYFFSLFITNSYSINSLQIIIDLFSLIQLNSYSFLSFSQFLSFWCILFLFHFFGASALFLLFAFWIFHAISSIRITQNVPYTLFCVCIFNSAKRIFAFPLFFSFCLFFHFFIFLVSASKLPYVWSSLRRTRTVRFMCVVIIPNYSLDGTRFYKRARFAPKQSAQLVFVFFGLTLFIIFG